MDFGTSAPASGRLLPVAVACAVLSGCGAEPERPLERPAAEVESLTRAAPEEIRYELENLRNEIDDLETIIETGSAVAQPGSDPPALLAEARSAYRAALDALADSDEERAADSLEVASRRVESVKRSMGLAEEWGEPFDAESVPVTVPDELSS